MANSRVYTVLLFAMLREKAGNSISIELPADETTAQELVTACAAQYPQLSAWLPHVKIAVNCAYVTPEQTIRPADEIALIPPVAGG
jgi:molybdopterin synthase catalytic subunit